MSFSSDIKRELSSLKPGSRDAMLAELAAILENSADIRLNPFGLRIMTENAMAISRVEQLLSRIFNITLEVRGRYGLHGSRVRTYEGIFQDRDAVPDVLRELGFLPDGEESFVRVPDEILLESEEGMRAYLRGAFLSSGSLIDPYKKYHLEFVGRTEAFALRVQSLLERVGIAVRYLERKRTSARSAWVVYIKDGEDIVDVLNLIGAHTALLRMEEIRVEKEVRNAINRRCNCDSANSQKMVNAAVRVNEDILYLKERGLFELLPEALRETAELRLENTELSLQELGSMLEKPVGKSGVNHRLKKISEIAADFRRSETLAQPEEV